jgi:hypothetical protein
MSTTLCGWPGSARAVLACVLACSFAWLSANPARGAQARQPSGSPEAVPSQLLSDDERIDFCTQMRRAATPEQRRAVAARLHDTLTPRAQVQGVELPAWVKEGQPAGGSRLPGLSCDSGAARSHAQATTSAPETSARKSGARESAESKPAAPREVAARATSSAAQMPLHESAAQTTATNTVPAAVPVTQTPTRNAARGDIPVEQDHGVAYVTGGVGQDEAMAIRGLATGYNMRATFTTRSGEYLSGVNVHVVKADGTTVFAATSDGPYLFARLPQGHYRVVASAEGVERSREFYVPSHGGVRFTLVWPSLRTTLSN